MCEETERVLRAYLQRTLGVQEDAWGIRPSRFSGRGVFATRDLLPGDLVFHDRPVVAGPRAKPDKPMCASCHRRGRVSKCPEGCFLPICSEECAIASTHRDECRVVRESMSLPPGSWRLDLLGTVVPLRCLFLSPEDREVVHCLQGNQGKIHGIEVDLLRFYMKEKLSREDEEWMRQCCLAMDTNAFEFIKVLGDGSQSSLRGLYPLASIMNHDCSPNSCHIYDKDGIMKVFAARPIAAGEEITTSYSALLWSTSIRRLNLAHTKHFLCCCARCSDPTEFGSMLSCLPCTEGECSGLLLPANPLKHHSSWFCGSCSIEVSPKEVMKRQAAQGTLLQSLANSDPPTMVQFLIAQGLPPQNQVVLQLKVNLIWQLGDKDGFKWHELTQEMLDCKEKWCKDVLETLETLRFGFCRMKGLILLELHGALFEQQRRLQLSGLNRPGIEAQMQALLAIATQILQDDGAAQTKLIQTQNRLLLLPS